MLNTTVLLYDINRAISTTFPNIQIKENPIENSFIQQYINIKKPYWSIKSTIPLVNDSILTKYCLPSLHKGLLIDSVQNSIINNKFPK